MNSSVPGFAIVFRILQTTELDTGAPEDKGKTRHSARFYPATISPP
jgi:hypothetical protein